VPDHDLAMSLPDPFDDRRSDLLQAVMSLKIMGLQWP